VPLPGGGVCALHCSRSHARLFAAASLAASNACKRAARPTRAHKPFTLQPPPLLQHSDDVRVADHVPRRWRPPLRRFEAAAPPALRCVGLCKCAVKQAAARVGGGSSPAPLDRVFYCEHLAGSARGIKALDFLRQVAARAGLAPREQRLRYGCARYDTVGCLRRIACESWFRSRRRRCSPCSRGSAVATRSRRLLCRWERSWRRGR
jgi:hypothetical protein